MTNGEAIDRVQSLYSKGVASDDSRLEPRLIFSNLTTVRAKILERKANKKQKVSQWNYQVIPCLEMEIAPPHECPCAPPIGCKILKSKYQIPQPITNLNMHMITVTSVYGTEVYDEVTWKGKKRKNGNSFTASKPDFFIRNRYLYITSKDAAQVVSVEGLFQNPEDVASFITDCGDPVGGLDGGSASDSPCVAIPDLIFPADDSLLDDIIELATIRLINAFNSAQEDITNNTRDSRIEQGK